MNFDDLSRNELIFIRHECDKDLLFFTKFWFRVLRGTKFITNWHHQAICDELKRIENYDLELLSVNIPPRFSKTEICAVNFIARGVGMNPNSNWLYITASDELRAQTSVSIRDIVSHPYFKIMYDVELKKDQNAKNLWRTTQGGGLKTATISGQITGFGAGQMIVHEKDLEDFIRNFEGCIVLDDINKIDDTESENANNDKVNRVLFNTILSRKNSSDTPMINIQQRAGELDATEKLQEYYKDNNKAKFLVIPARDEKGVPTWEWKLDREKLLQLEKSHQTAHIFETQYQQNPSSKSGKMFPLESLKRYESKDIDIKDADFCLSIIDPKDDGKDYICNLYGYGYDGKIYINDLVFNDDDSEISMSDVSMKLNTLKPRYTRVEKNGGGGHYARFLRSKTKAEILTSNTTMNKHTKIITWSAFIKEFFYFRSDYEIGSDYDKFMKQLLGYRKNKDESKKLHDDAPDGCCMMGIMAKSFYPHLYESITDQ